MKIESIEIKNFKGLKDAVFHPKSFSCLVGENNSGKSTVLQAIVYALNRPKNIPASMFYDEQEPIELRLKLANIRDGDLNRLQEDHRLKLSPLIYGGELILTSRYTKSDGLTLLVSKLTPTETKYREDAINENFKGLRSVAQAVTVVETHYIEFRDALPDNASPAQVKEYLNNRISMLPPEQFSYVDSALPSGIPSSISSLLPEPIYIPAVKNFDDDLKITQSTSFGRLIGLLMEDLIPDLNDINTALLDLKKKLNRFHDEDGVLQDFRLEKVKGLESTIEGFLAENFPKVKVDLEIPPPEIKTILNTAKIYVNDGSRDLIDNKGDGVKRSLTFSLLRSYVDMLSRRGENDPAAESQASSRPLIFLFEEPELYLHPKAQRTLFSTLSKISFSHQTVISTHSPIFFEPGVTAQFVRVAKENATPKPIGKLYPVDFDIDQESLNVFRMAKYDHSEAGFFSSEVVLYEGESDDYFFRHVSKTLNPLWNFEDRNIALVEVGGKGNFSKFREFFESFGLAVSILTDLDSLLADFTHLGASDETALKRDLLLQALDAYITANNVKPQLSGKRVKRKVNNPRWVEKYEQVKVIISEISVAGTASPEQIAALGTLFTWENTEAKYIALSTNDEGIQNHLIELLDDLRSEKIFVLSRGAIEDYYPAGITAGTSKPERALKVIEHISTRDIALGLSQPLAAGRQTEFEEIFSEIFQN